jgi:hypothetical protein
MSESDGQEVYGNGWWWRMPARCRCHVLACYGYRRFVCLTPVPPTTDAGGNMSIHAGGHSALLVQ